ncbi:MAG: HlyD family type I secretion periplasmic adaptor subunit [Nitrospirales bacterium]|nr:MAG: HlyD family type I secretion periplasmic adaptor subunit [Nitrospirales bacterium]
MKHTEEHISRSLNRHLIVSLLLIILLVGGVGSWAMVQEIHGAVIASGVVVVEGNAKRVQHQEGGIVKAIYVQDGAVVEAGDLLVHLDDTVVKANLAMITGELGKLNAQETRLVAERDGKDRLVYSQVLREQASQDTALANSLSDQRALKQARIATLRGRKGQLQEQISQFNEQIEGLEVQRDAKTDNINLIDERLSVLEPLLPEGLVTASEITAFKRDRAELSGDRGALIAQMAQAHETVSERRLQILQLEDEFRSQVLEELQDVRARMTQLREEKVAALDKLQRVEIRAPRTGFIHQLNVHTIGGVISAGETLMLIVPREDVLIVETRLQPIDVDQVVGGQQATVRFPGFHQRTTPELFAQVSTISADLTYDEVTGSSYFLARLTIPEYEFSKLDGKALLPGMPVEAFIQTQQRTVLSYLVKPLEDHLVHAMKE